ncbi:hypothetical protein [uncultured Senegalimassilia sp.]|uniref:Uncharacterized protein n=1 Tax=Siphoviridae sp. ctqBc4 TaxID=2827945 RepID=A0A8S5SCE7_9CAUD|nr:hypothetical protein [uncultured Senegalimassilia sp.]DAF48622.1 MAG TPA: hypothetical protein [Siphoviridae sp. ctqBc4]
MQKLIGSKTTGKTPYWRQSRLYEDEDYDGSKIYRGVVETDTNWFDSFETKDRAKAMRWLNC